MSAVIRHICGSIIRGLCIQGSTKAQQEAMQAGQAPCGLSDCADATEYDAVKNEYELMFLEQSFELPWALQHIVADGPLPFLYFATARPYVSRTVSSLIFVIKLYIRLQFEVKVYRRVNF